MRQLLILFLCIVSLESFAQGLQITGLVPYRNTYATPSNYVFSDTNCDSLITMSFKTGTIASSTNEITQLIQGTNFSSTQFTVVVNWGDGATTTHFGNTSVLNSFVTISPVVSHHYNTPGNYSITTTVLNSQNQTSASNVRSVNVGQHFYVTTGNYWVDMIIPIDCNGDGIFQETISQVIPAILVNIETGLSVNLELNTGNPIPPIFGMPLGSYELIVDSTFLANNGYSASVYSGSNVVYNCGGQINFYVSLVCSPFVNCATNISQHVAADFSATYQTSSETNITNHAWEITAFDFNAQPIGTPIISNQSTAIFPSIIGASYVTACLNAEFVGGCVYNACDTFEVASGYLQTEGLLFCDQNNDDFYNYWNEFGIPNVPITISNLNTGYSFSTTTYGNSFSLNNYQGEIFAYSDGDLIISYGTPGLPGDTIQISINPNYLLNLGYSGVNPTITYLGHDLFYGPAYGFNSDTLFPINCTNFNPFPVLCYEGNVFCDGNDDGIQNFGEMPLVNAPITIDNYQGGSTTAITVYSDTSGYFHYCGAIFGVTGYAQATISSTWLANNGYTMASNNIFYIYGDTLASSQPLSIPVQCNNTCTDLWTTVTPWLGYYQNQTAWIKLNWGNYGPEAANYSLQLTWPQGVTIQTSSIQNPNYVISGNSITWNLGSISPGFNNTDILFFNIPFGLADGTQHLFNSTITPNLVSDCYNGNNQGGLLQILGNSYDPNDKNVYRKTFHENEMSGFSESDINFGEDDELEYTVRFQNTGTAPAQNIYILDTLDAELNWSTFELIYSTHEVEVENFGNGVLRFKFNNIWLPDSSVSQELSQGHFVFRMRENPGNPIGSVITNTAYIYFDWNEAIITNTTYNINDWIEFVGEENAFNVKAFPNPMNNELTLKVEGKFNYEIHDLTGRKLLQGMGVRQTTINTESLATGTYLLSVYVNGSRQTGKVVKR
ncbi:MAG: hypothetical protein RLZZ71_2278 [Bacteroidota bacterium]